MGVPRMSERTQRPTARGTGELRARGGARAPACAATDGPPPVLIPPRISASAPAAPTDFVYPVDWSPAGQRRWQRLAPLPRVRVARRRRTTTRPWSTASTRRSTRRCSLSSTTSQLLTRANMEEQIERFVAALHADLILPEDFSRRSARRHRRRRGRAASRCPSSRPGAAAIDALRLVHRTRASARTSSSAPVAAIRSHAASAAAGVERAQVELGRAPGRARGRGSAAG